MTELMTRPTLAVPRLWSPANRTGKPMRHKMADVMSAPAARRIPALLLPLIPIAVFLTLWQLLTAHNVVAWLRFNRMPAPGAVFHTLMTRASSGAFYDDLLASLQRILLGFGLAAVVGIGLGVLIGRSVTSMPRWSVLPMIWPALMPPPLSTVVQARA